MFQDARRYLPTNLAAANLDSARAFAERGRARLEEGRLLAAARLAEGKDLAIRAAVLRQGHLRRTARRGQGPRRRAAAKRPGPRAPVRSATRRDRPRRPAAGRALRAAGHERRSRSWARRSTCSTRRRGWLLAVPLAFARCGWLVGSLLLVGVFALNNASLAFLLRACLTTREHSYIGLCRAQRRDRAARRLGVAPLLLRLVRLVPRHHRRHLQPRHRAVRHRALLRGRHGNALLGARAAPPHRLHRALPRAALDAPVDGLAPAHLDLRHALRALRRRHRRDHARRRPAARRRASGRRFALGRLAALAADDDLLLLVAVALPR